MWFRDYQDYPNDRPGKRQKVEPGHGIVGCEMHEVVSWQTTLHRPGSHRPGLISNLIRFLTGGK